MTIRVSEFDWRYWEGRYAKEQSTRPEGFDWLASYNTPVVRDTINRHFQKDHVILELGCGTSRLMHDLANDGYLRLKAIDYSQAAIDLQKANHGNAGIDFRCMDVGNLVFKDASIDGIIDKATMDSLDCCMGVDDLSAAHRAVQEAYRVLKPKGRWIVISLRDPKRRVEDFEGLFRLVELVEVKTSDASPCADYFLYCFEREAKTETSKIRICA